MRWIWAAAALVACEGGRGEPVDFATDIRPLLADNCARCHGSSALAPGDFLDYDTASRWAEAMISRIDAGEMPPPQADPDCHPYQDDDLGELDPALRGAIRSWIDAGKPEGDLAAAPEVSIREPATLSRRDRVLEAAAPIAPTFAEGNEYRCFLLGEVEEDAYVTGIEFLLDNPPISHHALLFLDTDAGSEALIEDGPSKSWTCPSVNPRPEWYAIHAWAPSSGAVEFTDGRGLKLTRGQQLILQMHYYAGASEALEDLPGYALKLEPEVERELYYAPVGPEDFVIPAGDPSYTASLELPIADYFYGLPIEVFGVMPHMHLLGTGYDFHAVDADGKETCIARSDGFDFSTQPTYWFDEPVRLDGSSRVSVSCTYDNSTSNPHQQNDPPRDVSWGENTQQEMCFALMYVGLP